MFLRVPSCFFAFLRVELCCVVWRCVVFYRFVLCCVGSCVDSDVEWNYVVLFYAMLYLILQSGRYHNDLLSPVQTNSKTEHKPGYPKRGTACRYASV